MIESEEIVHRGVCVTVRYVSAEELGHYLGFAFGKAKVALVRADLPVRVKRFVKKHELYHLVDQYQWGGWLGGEIRATLVPGATDPVGMFATVWYILRRRGVSSYFKKIVLGRDLPDPPKLY